MPKLWIGLAPRPDRRRQRDAERLADRADLLDGDAQRREVAAAAAPLLGEHDAEQPELGHLLDRLERQLAGGLPLVDARGQLAPGEVAHDIAKRDVLVVEVDHRANLPRFLERSLGRR